VETQILQERGYSLLVKCLFVSEVSIMIWIGTSGYSYPEWKGRFYPEKFPQSKMLGFYCEHFNTVEINNTFYHLPTIKMVETWVQNTPKEFKLTFKAPRQITHFSKLKDCSKVVDIFWMNIRLAEEKLGAVLFQLPPFLKLDLGLLGEFLSILPREMKASFEFRHESWFCRGTYDLLREKGKALCIADSEKIHTPIEETAAFGYLRLRDEGYQDQDLEKWAEVIQERAAKWKDIFVYFKHEKKGIGPEFAERLKQILNKK
jgi:uncharacterized protein YecE (DUF72 family)